MHPISLLLAFVPFLTTLILGPAAAQAGPAILSPEQGAALQGVVTVKGTSYVSGFVYSELAFGYAGDSTGTWFIIASSSQAVYQNDLAIWDTTTITDGNYILRLRVFLSDGRHLDSIVPALRVRNYTPIETPTPTRVPTLAPTAMKTAVKKPTATPTITLTPTLFPTPTVMPGNSAIITTRDLGKSIAFGGVAALLFLFILSLYVKLRRL